jgi:hypothetical protein
MSRAAATWLKMSVLLAALGVGNGRVLAQDVPSQAPQHQFGDARDCPPGYRIEFVLPRTTIYVDPRWLGSGTIVELQHTGGPACPTGSIKRNGIELGYGILRAMGLHHGIGSRLMRFGIGGDPTDPQTLSPARPESDTEPQRSAAWIKDDTSKWMLTQSPTSRAYLLFYPTPKGVPNRPVRISCGGGEIIPGTQQRMLRTCGKDTIAGRDTPFDSIHYSYIVSQADVSILDVSTEYSTDPTSEPGALLEFDSRFREWFLTLKQKP